MSKSMFVLFVLLASFAQSQQYVAAADISLGGCPVEMEATFACRSYQPESGNLQGKVDRLTFIVLRYGNVPAATQAYMDLSVNGYPSDSEGYVFDGVTLGDKYIYHPPAKSSSSLVETSFLKVLDENVISLWIVEGTEVDLATALSISYSKWEIPQGSTKNTASITEFLPGKSVIPLGFVLSDEYPKSADVKPDQQVTRTTRTTAKPTATASRTTGSSSTSGSIEILDISNKDAGYGNGNYYIYVEVKNNTGQYLSYVQVDLTCRDSSGSVVGTGIANYAGMSPGETVVLTGLMLDVPNCVKINARVNPLTG